MRSRKTLQQFVRFCLVGALATLLDAALFYLLRQWMPYRVAMVVSYATCLCLNMLATLVWTFGTKVSMRNATAVVGAHLLNLFVVRFGLMALFVDLMHMNDRVAYLPTLAISVLTNYCIIRTIVRPAHGRPDTEPEP